MTKNEAVAQAVYDVMPYDDLWGTKPPWVDGENSLRQYDARDIARAAIEAADRHDAEPEEQGMGRGEFTIREETHDPFAKLPELAERLGVKEGFVSGAFVISTVDGRSYDFFALISAFLDKIESVER